MTTETLLHENDISLETLQSIVLHDGKDTCFFNLRELTRRELVSVGSDGNILRWKAGDPPNQTWLIVPVDSLGHCKILTLGNGECMAVGANGNILRWADTHGPEQLFQFVNFRKSDGSYNIRENTKQEMVAVGSNGNILRWAPTGGDEQRFVPEPTNVVAADPTKFAPLTKGRTIYEPDQVPGHPAMKELNLSPPEPKDDYLIGVDTLPSVFVNDSAYPNKIAQAKEQPYYYLRRTMRWKKIKDQVFQKGMRQTYSAEVYHGSSCTDIHSLETTIGVVVGAKVAGEIGKVPGKNGGVSAKVSGELNFQYTWQRRELEQMEQKKEEYHKEVETVEFTPAQECRLVLWQLVDQYTLFDSALKSVGHGWMVYTGRTEWDIFPKRTEMLVHRRS